MAQSRDLCIGLPNVGQRVTLLCRIGRKDDGQRAPMLSPGRDTRIRDLRVGSIDVGQHVPILNQGHDARIRDRCAGQRCVGQRVPLLSYSCHALIRDLCVGQPDDWTASDTTQPRP